MFLLFWPFYSDIPEARLFAAVVPALQLVRLLLAGLKSTTTTSSEGGKSGGLVNAISRTGESSEALGGLSYTPKVSWHSRYHFRPRHLHGRALACNPHNLQVFAGRIEPLAAIL